MALPVCAPFFLWAGLTYCDIVKQIKVYWGQIYGKNGLYRKDCFKTLFEKIQGPGYVLDFSNRTFQEFVYSIMEIDIYAKYPGLSKGRILNKIIDVYDNVTVGKLLLELLRYMQAKELIVDEDKKTFRKCAEIGNRLIGRITPVRTSVQHSAPKTPIKSVIDYDKYLNVLKNLSNLADTPQARGFLLVFRATPTKLYKHFQM